jgi:hypothetical protein
MSSDAKQLIVTLATAVAACNALALAPTARAADPSAIAASPIAAAALATLAEARPSRIRLSRGEDFDEAFVTRM